jgi:hypothetical protein
VLVSTWIDSSGAFSYPLSARIVSVKRRSAPIPLSESDPPRGRNSNCCGYIWIVRRFQEELSGEGRRSAPSADKRRDWTNKHRQIQLRYSMNTIVEKGWRCLLSEKLAHYWVGLLTIIFVNIWLISLHVSIVIVSTGFSEKTQFPSRFSMDYRSWPKEFCERSIHQISSFSSRYPDEFGWFAWITNTTKLTIPENMMGWLKSPLYSSCRPLSDFQAETCE